MWYVVFYVCLCIVLSLSLNFRLLFNVMKVKVKKWHATATWKWGIDEDVCGICRNAFEACAPNVKYPGDDCKWDLFVLFDNF